MNRHLRIGDEPVALPLLGPDGQYHAEIDCGTGAPTAQLGAEALAAIAEPLPELEDLSAAVPELEQRVAALERGELERRRAAADMRPAEPVPPPP